MIPQLVWPPRFQPESGALRCKGTKYKKVSCFEKCYYYLIKEY